MKVLDFGLAKAGRVRGRPGRDTTSDAVADDDGRRHARGRDARHGGLHESRAGARPAGRQAHRHLGLRLRAVRNADRPPAFPGETVSDTIAAILEREPDWPALPARHPRRSRACCGGASTRIRKRACMTSASARLEIEDEIAGSGRAAERAPGDRHVLHLRSGCVDLRRRPVALLTLGVDVRMARASTGSQNSSNRTLSTSTSVPTAPTTFVGERPQRDLRPDRSSSHVPRAVVGRPPGSRCAPWTPRSA